MSLIEYPCPIDGCEWMHAVSTELGWELPPGWTVEPVEVVTARVEAALARHVETHLPVEYVRTIRRLQHEVHDLMISLAVPVDHD